MSFRSDWCPTECVKTGIVFVNENRTNYCDECPQKKERAKFRLSFEAQVLQRLNRGKKFVFDEMLAVLYRVQAAEDLSKELMSVKTQVLLGVYLRSKSTFDKEKREKEKKN